MSRTHVDDRFTDAFDALLALAQAAAERLLGRGPEAEDAAAEALARLSIRWPRLSGAPYRDAWLVRVTTNLAIDQLRRKQLTPVEPVDVVDPAEGVVVAQVLIADITRLSRRQREVVVLHYMAAFTVHETAKALRISPTP